MLTGTNWFMTKMFINIYFLFKFIIKITSFAKYRLLLCDEIWLALPMSIKNGFNCYLYLFLQVGNFGLPSWRLRCRAFQELGTRRRTRARVSDSVRENHRTLEWPDPAPHAVGQRYKNAGWCVLLLLIIIYLFYKLQSSSHDNIVYSGASQARFPFPIINDKDQRVAERLSMIDIEELDDEGFPLVWRAVFVMDPEKRIRASSIFPAAASRRIKYVGLIKV